MSERIVPARIPSARISIREATDKARRCREAATRLNTQWEAAQTDATTPAAKKHTNQIRRLLEQNLARAREWETREKELKS